MSRTLIAVLLMAITTTTTRADWQFTHWGMSPDEAIAASQERAIETSEETRSRQVWERDLTAQLQMPWTSGQFDFQAFLHFTKDTRELAVVELSYRSTHRPGIAVERTMRRKYGAPVFELETEFNTLVQWHVGGDEISYRSGPRGVTVSYQPRLDRHNSGL